MKKKIVYISGNEIFNIDDIHAAFDEIRNALNLGQDTILFGVPVDKADSVSETQNSDIQPMELMPDLTPDITISESDAADIIKEDSLETAPETIQQDIKPVKENVVKKRGRPRKEPVAEVIEDTVETINESIEQPSDITPESDDENNEKVVPILSVLSTKEEDTPTEDTVLSETSIETIEIIPESDEIIAPSVQDTPDQEISTESDEEDSDDIGLEKLLSAMTPLQEDTSEKIDIKNVIPEPIEDDESVDTTLEQLATEFIENQDKIVSESKSGSRSKIGKLRNILPFKQSKRQDQGLGDLFGWAGVAANDEEFSVPGFFTNVASKK